MKVGLPRRTPADVVADLSRSVAARVPSHMGRRADSSQDHIDAVRKKLPTSLKGVADRVIAAIVESKLPGAVCVVPPNSEAAVAALAASVRGVIQKTRIPAPNGHSVENIVFSEDGATCALQTSYNGRRHLIRNQQVHTFEPDIQVGLGGWPTQVIAIVTENGQLPQVFIDNKPRWLPLAHSPVCSADGSNWALLMETPDSWAGIPHSGVPKGATTKTLQLKRGPSVGETIDQISYPDIRLPVFSDSGNDWAFSRFRPVADTASGEVETADGTPASRSKKSSCLLTAAPWPGLSNENTGTKS